ncbi:MAG: hypothetical protein V2B19_32305 [Pseudomonadota bacterium]
MRVVIVDAREWQNQFDLETGEKTHVDGPLIDRVSGVLSRHPYPGDVHGLSNRWVTDTALDLIDQHGPRFVFLSYAQQYFFTRFNAVSADERRSLIAEVFLEVARFVEKSGFTPFILGTGDMVPFKGFIDVSRLDGLAITAHWSGRYAGLHDPSDRDLNHLRGQPHIEAIISKKDWMAIAVSPLAAVDRIPDYLLLSEPGWVFKSVGTPLRSPGWLPAPSFRIPYRTPLGIVEDLTRICSAVEAWRNEAPIALIVLEGIGMADFPGPFAECQNSLDWYYYVPGEAQYLTLCTGAHSLFSYPAGYKFSKEEEKRQRFPFSGFITALPENTLCDRIHAGSIAVGNRSMFMHTMTGADIAVECFARNLYNQGTMAAIRLDKNINLFR